MNTYSDCKHPYTARARAMNEGNCPCCLLMDNDRLLDRAINAERVARMIQRRLPAILFRLLTKE